MQHKVIADISCWEDALVFHGSTDIGFVRKPDNDGYEYVVYAPLGRAVEDSMPNGMIRFLLNDDVFDLTHIFLYNKTADRNEYAQGRGFGELTLRGLTALASSLGFHKMRISDTANYLLCRMVYLKFSAQARYAISDICRIEEDINVSFTQYDWFAEDVSVELQLTEELCPQALLYTCHHRQFIQDTFVPGQKYSLKLEQDRILVYNDFDSSLVAPQDIVTVRFPSLDIDITWNI